MPARQSTLSLLLLVALFGCQQSDPPPSAKPTSEQTPAASASSTSTPSYYQVPVSYHKLDNGLKVVLSPDYTAPTVTVAVYYNIGFRIEPRDRTGFAHLFEHMMFQGSRNLGKLEFIQLINRNGGVLNGSTRFDYTNYFEIVPAHKLETMLWAEADRMRGLAVTQESLDNQREVVKNEVKVNVLNQPYGGFPWLDMPQYANKNWYNAHNFYGDLADLDAANLQDVAAFFDQYYAPNNAVVAIVGDFDQDQALALVQRYFGDIARSKQAIQWPDISEPPQQQQEIAEKEDPLAQKPGFAIAYHVPERLTPEWYAMGLLDQILLQGQDSLLYQALVKKHGMTSNVSGGINLLGNMFNYKGPMLWTASLIHDAELSQEQIIEAWDEALEPVRQQPIKQEVIDRALVKWRSGYYDTLSNFFGFGRADLMAALALFDDDPSQINRFEQNMHAVTPELLLRTAQRYLDPSQRTILILKAGKASTSGENDNA